MKILIISDLHYVEYRKWQEFKKTFGKDGIRANDYELIITLGDIDQMLLIDIANNFSHKEKIGVLGNHDDYRNLKNYNVINMDKLTFELEDEKFFGLHGSIRYKSGEYASYTQEESVDAASTDYAATIMIAHSAPNGINDKSDEAHIGLIGINEYMEKHNPKLVLHGHVHRTAMSFVNETTVVSVYGGIILDTNTLILEPVLRIEC